MVRSRISVEHILPRSVGFEEPDFISLRPIHPDCSGLFAQVGPRPRILDRGREDPGTDFLNLSCSTTGQENCRYDRNEKFVVHSSLLNNLTLPAQDERRSTHRGTVRDEDGQAW